eukprot:s10_g29.t2
MAAMEDGPAKELLESLQGCWQNVKEPHEFYMVWENSVTRIRQNTGETLDFWSILRPDATGSGLQWGVHGRFVLKIDSSSLSSTSEVFSLSWLTPEEAHTQAIAGPREPGENGVKGWKWQRVDPALVGLADYCGPSAGQVEQPSRAALANVDAHGKQAVVAELQGMWKNYLDDNESYVVRGMDVMRFKAGVEAKPFRLHWDDATGRLWWGSTGRYSLQPPTDTPLTTAVWESCDGSGRGFCWERHASAVPPGGKGLHKVPRPPSTPPPIALRQQQQRQMQQQQMQQQQQQQQQQMQQMQHQQMLWSRHYAQQWHAHQWHAAYGQYGQWPHQQQWYSLPVAAGYRYSPY